jgi:hypothetical protein
MEESIRKFLKKVEKTTSYMQAIELFEQYSPCLIENLKNVLDHEENAALAHDVTLSKLVQHLNTICKHLIILKDPIIEQCHILSSKVVIRMKKCILLHLFNDDEIPDSSYKQFSKKKRGRPKG